MMNIRSDAASGSVAETGAGTGSDVTDGGDRGTTHRRRRWLWLVTAALAVALTAAACGDSSDTADPGDGATTVATSDQPATTVEVLEGEAFGDNRTLDRYWDLCEGGDGAACDDLFHASQSGTEYSTFGATCGNQEPEPVDNCDDLYKLEF